MLASIQGYEKGIFLYDKFLKLWNLQEQGLQTCSSNGLVHASQINPEGSVPGMDVLKAPLKTPIHQEMLAKYPFFPIPTLLNQPVPLIYMSVFVYMGSK